MENLQLSTFLIPVIALILVVLLYIFLSTMAQNRTAFTRTLMLVVVGGIGAILAEMKYSSEGTWAYTETMPILPIVNVGLSPVLQFMVLPALTYYLAFKILKKIQSDNETEFIKIKNKQLWNF